MKTTTRAGEMGVQLIDRDHREIAEMMIAINYDATRDPDPTRQLRRLRELERMVRSHFLLEECAMTAARFRGLAVHKMRHQWMMEQIRRLSASWKNEKNALIREPMALLWESHVLHVEGEDRAFGLWLDGADAAGAQR